MPFLRDDCDDWCEGSCKQRGLEGGGCKDSQCICKGKDPAICESWCRNSGFPGGTCKDGQCTCGFRPPLLRQSGELRKD